MFTRALLIFTLFLFFFNQVSAQTNLWTDIREKEIQLASNTERHIFPTTFRTLKLDKAAIETALASAPTEADFNNGSPGIVLEFPTPDGTYERYEVWYSPVMAPELCAQYPNIRSYAGRSIKGTASLIRFDVSPNGLNYMCRQPGKNTIFIAPYAFNDASIHICYYKKDHPNEETFFCGVTEQETGDQTAIDSLNWGHKIAAGDCGNLRVYRLALACTGEYATFHGGTVPGALAAMNTSMTRVNGVYEPDVSIRMVIIANNTSIIYTNAATDPYTNSNGSTMLGQNQTNLDAVIGTANYDIGHVFSTGGGGVASLRSPCTGNKARGVTGRGSPVGDAFDIDYVAHEMGHQWGGNHTFFNSCSGNRNSSTAMEPGSGSTIQAYAGICSPDVQPNSDDYFHAISLQEIGAFVTTGNGNNCDVPTANGNQQPVVAALTNRSIPVSTPFLLAGSATDGNGDALLYTWEQMDAFTTTQTMPPAATNTSGPMFRSYEPASSPNRYCPRLSDLFSGNNNDWEELPSVGRTMLFRLTAYDRRTGGGCTDQKDMTVTTVSAAGPFVVTVPSLSGISYPTSSAQTVTWNVANTTASPVSCANVDILISTDGGQTFSTLVANTPNDGSQSVTMPSTSTQTARIMVRSVGNIFFDISDNDFSLGVFCGQVVNSFDVPKTIPTTPATITSTLVVSSAASILDVNVSSLSGTHTYMADLTFKLKSPLGTERTLFGGICGSNDNFNLMLDDESSNTTISCPPTSGGAFKPTQTLSAFDNESTAGTWTLTVTDGFANDGGSLNAWGISFCTATALLLPVEWLNFSATAVDSRIQLKWATATEKDNKGFHVERSTDQAATKFERIAWMPGNGTKLDRSDYSMFDPNIEAGKVYYYRLAQEDINGEIVYSEVRVVVTPGKFGTIQIAPNPAYQTVQLFFEGGSWKGEGESQLRILQSDGRIVMDQQVPTDGVLDIESLPSGMYQVQVLSEREVWVGKLIRK